jgi:signal transduction histidine kinase
VPPPVGVCAYRIVQESLSNASRHAPGAPVTVWVSHDRHTMLLRVENGPAATHTPAAKVPVHAAVNGQASVNGHAMVRDTGAGQGLAGMRERAALLGGTLSAGPSPDGGFTVCAVLPINNAA